MEENIDKLIDKNVLEEYLISKLSNGCDGKKIKNLKTGRCVNFDGAVGRPIIDEYKKTHKSEILDTFLGKPRILFTNNEAKIRYQELKQKEGKINRLIFEGPLNTNSDIEYSDEDFNFKNSKARDKYFELLKQGKKPNYKHFQLNSSSPSNSHKKSKKSYTSSTSYNSVKSYKKQSSSSSKYDSVKKSSNKELKDDLTDFVTKLKDDGYDIEFNDNRTELKLSKSGKKLSLKCQLNK